MRSWKLLVVDDHTEGRFLLVRTLLRKFPTALITECIDGAAALAAVLADRQDALVVHRGGEMDGLTLVRELRAVDANVPILYVSGIDRTREAAKAGATRFLHFDEWLRVGTVIADMLEADPVS